MSALSAALESICGADPSSTIDAGPHGASLPLAAPASEREAIELLRMAARDRLRVLPLGSGTKLCWCRPPRAADFALTTRALTGIVAYEPGDGTLTALAGTRWSALAETVRRGGHRLTPDVPRPKEATLGGVLAAGQSGADRLRFGPLRHHVLGTRSLLASGEVTRSGGRLVKNVTGYDLHRLYCGSHGTLCILLEASLRLFPEPQAMALASVDRAHLDQALCCARRILATRAQPTSLAIENLREREEGCWRIHLLLEGRAEVVRSERELLAPELEGASWVEGEAARALAGELRDLEPDARARSSLHITLLPTRLGDALDLLVARLGARSLPLRALLHPGVAAADVVLDGLAGELAAALVTELRADLAPLGGRVHARGIDWSAAADLDPFGEPSPALPWMQRLRSALDPHELLARGRFHGGL